ncbi:MAG TPA: hypothetical protein VLY45_04105 [Nitrospiria bacterium]|nr:hypothetical protein [Nitrospiria bacterium]
MIRQFTVILVGIALLIATTTGSSTRAHASTPDNYFVTQIALDPQNTENLYALTTYSIGVLRSRDGGEHWTQINKGIRSYSLYQLTVHPRNPKILYLGAGGAGLYKSTDGGDTWIEMNQGLQNTDIGELVLHPDNPDIVYVVTSTGVFKSPDGGAHWVALNQGDDFSESQQYQSLLVLPTSPPTLFLASRRGLYTRREGDAGWVAVPGILNNKQISALADDPRTGRLYAGVMRRGKTTKTLNEGGLFVSEDRGAHWTRLGKGLERDWIRTIVIDPVDPRTIYLTTSGRGLLKSRDGGLSWNEINAGLADGDRDFRDLVMDPRDRNVLYAGSHGYWLYRTRDAGASWTPLPLGPHQTTEQLLDALTQEDARVQTTSPVHLPAVFAKCNRCHGWTDPHLNLHHGNWRVTANPRDWAPSVNRMSKGAGLTHDEEIQLADFLNRYTHGARSGSAATPTAAPQRGVSAVIPISVFQKTEEEDPVVAWDGHTYMVAWQSNRKDPYNYDVYVTRVGPDGTVLNPRGTPITSAPSNQIFADLAWGAGQYLAVWQDLRSRQRWEIYGTRFLPDGTIRDPQGIPMAVGTRNARHPQVAWDGKNFLVVWMEENEGRGWDIAGVRIHPDGTVLDKERILIASAPGDQTNPAIAWGGGQYLVVWMDTQPNAAPVIAGVRLDETGAVLDHERVVLSHASRHPAFPSVAWGNGRFVVVWGDQLSDAVHALSGIRVSSTGALVDGKEFTVASSPHLHTFPSVRCAGSECLVVWEEDKTVGVMRGIDDVIRDVRGAFLHLDQPVVTPDDIMITPDAVGNHFAKVASDGRNFLVVWKDYRSGTAESLGRLVPRAPR